MIPGELFVEPGELALNAGRETHAQGREHGRSIVQVGSHYHFYETNLALRFERDRALGFRLDIPAGTAVRFEPGQERTIELVAYGGARIVYGLQRQGHG